MSGLYVIQHPPFCKIATPRAHIPPPALFINKPIVPALFINKPIVPRGIECINVVTPCPPEIPREMTPHCSWWWWTRPVLWLQEPRPTCDLPTHQTVSDTFCSSIRTENCIHHLDSPGLRRFCVDVCDKIQRMCQTPTMQLPQRGELVAFGVLSPSFVAVRSQTLLDSGEVFGSLQLGKDRLRRWNVLVICMCPFHGHAVPVQRRAQQSM
mmetsp:Transcript_26932/g.44587  ORF Transcript_26932/g.44587 Transcript_26932/m.44587 type:complete len:210 (+) Transcript_26932:124-753(+)